MGTKTKKGGLKTILKKASTAAKKSVGKVKTGTKKVIKTTAKTVAKKATTKGKKVAAQAKQAAKKRTQKAKKVGAAVSKTAKNFVAKGTKKVAETLGKVIEGINSKPHCTKIWTHTSGNFPEKGHPWLKGKCDLGICFSGGGSRSAALTHGQIRALKELKIYDKAKYVSCVSGGSFTATAYTFISKEDEKPFLGDYCSPESLTKKKLETIGKKNFAYCISHARVAGKTIKAAAEQLIKGGKDENWARIVCETYLKPYGLGDREKMFTLDKNSLSDIIKRNPHLTAKDFYCARQGTPYLIAAGTLHRPKLCYYHMEYTPLYVGVNTLHKKKGQFDRDIGGGFIEPHAFDSKAPDKKDIKGNTCSVKIGRKYHRFSICDMIGSDGSAPTIVARCLRQLPAAKSPGILRFIANSFPKFRYWPVSRVGEMDASEYDFGDAGIMDSYGIMPLLKRGVKNIICFINTNCEFDFDLQRDYQTPKDLTSLSIDPFFLTLFGMEPDKLKTGIFDKTLRKRLVEYNCVFPEKCFKDVLNTLLKAKKETGSCVAKTCLPVAANNHYGICKQDKVNILWVYNCRPEPWLSALPKETKSIVSKDFPFYSTFVRLPKGKEAKSDFKTLLKSAEKVLSNPIKTCQHLFNGQAQKDHALAQFLDNCPAILDITEKQANLLSQVGSWTVLRQENKKLFTDMLKK